VGSGTDWGTTEMRRRFVRSTLAIVLSGYLLLSAAMVFASNRGILAEARQRLGAEAERISLVLHDRLQVGREVEQRDLEILVPADREVTLVFTNGVVVRAGADVGEGGYAETRPVMGYGVVTVAEASGRVRRAQLMSAGSIVGLAVVLSVVSVGFAVRQSRRLSAPLAELAAEAERLGSGDVGPVPGRYGIPEVDALAEALDSSAARIGSLMESERQLTVDASHRLRTPLTALSMRLEEIQRSDDLAVTRREAAAALEQVERLTGVVDDLMARRTRGAEDVRVPIHEVVRQQVVEWEQAFGARGRPIRTEVQVGSETPVPRGAVNQVLACLLENSLQHGSGTTSIRTRGLDGALCVEVTDDGPGVPPDLAGRVFDRWVSGSGRTGVGLAMARAAAESVNGRLELVTAAPARFALFLPTGPAPGAPSRREDDLGEHPPAVGPEPEGRPEPDADDVGGDVVGDR